MFSASRVQVWMAALAATVFASCSRPGEPPPEPAPAAVEAAKPASPLPLPLEPPAPLARPELLAAVARAADAFGSGAPSPPEVVTLAGRSYRLSLPFGCFGASASDAQVGYEWDATRQALKLTAIPDNWSDTAWLRARLGQTEVDTIEGFWLRRPWLRGEACPGNPPSGPANPTPQPETVGLMRVFGPEEPRALQRGQRPYQVTRKLGPDEAPSPAGYRLVLEGRLRAVGGTSPILCHNEHPDRRPVCLVSLTFDRVVLETATGDLLAEWRS